MAEFDEERAEREDRAFQESLPDYETNVAELPEEGITGSHDIMGSKVSYLRDGGIEIDFDNDPDVDVFAGEEGFAANLALYMESGELGSLANTLDEMVDADIESRSDHDKLIDKALEVLGLKDMPDMDAPFEGASQLNIPVVAEAVVNFQARAVEEFFPATGPVKATVMGERTVEKMEKAQRVESDMNYHLTEKDEGYYDDTDQMLLLLPIHGTMFRRGYQDVITGEPRIRSVSSKRCHVPYDAKSLQDSPRITYEYEMHENDLRRAMDAGAFRRVTLTDAVPEGDDGQSPEDISDNRSPVRSEEDNVYTLREVYIEHELPDGVDTYQDDKDFALPYIITYCVELDTVLAIRRNWKKNDEKCQKRQWIVAYKFLPGWGFYGWGFLHIIGNNARAASGALRALLDSAAVNNMPGGFMTREASNATRGDRTWVPGLFQETDLSAEELKNGFHALPVGRPSEALFRLLDMLVTHVRSFSSMTETVVGEASNTGPVGTTMALIEQSLKVFSGVHKRMHAAARREFKILHTLKSELLTEDKYEYAVEGASRYVLKSDFDSEVDVIPVSDPNIWSSTQRIAQAQAVYDMVERDQSGDFDDEARIEAKRRLLQALRVPEIDKLLPKKSMMRHDPVTENMMMQTGQPVRAYIEQDHDAHIATHEHFMAMMSNNKELMQRLNPIMQAHIAEHQALKYRLQVEGVMAQMGMQMPAVDLHNPNEADELPVEVENRISQMVAQVATKALQPPPPPPDQPPPEDVKTQAEIKRKDAAFAAEQKRKDAEFAAEQKRKDAETAAEIKRDNLEAAAEIENESASKIAQLFQKINPFGGDRGRGT